MAAHPASRAELNLIIPKPVPGELARPQLLRRLTSSPDGVLILTAPSGYGKTTLLSQYARAMTEPIVWLSLQEDSADLTRLAGMLVTAITETLPDWSFPHWSEVPERSLAPELLARALIQDLHQFPERRLHLILDDAEHLGADAGLWLSRLAAELTGRRQHRLLISGHSIDTIRPAHLVARGLATLLQPEEFTFSADETRRYFDQRRCPGNPAEVHAALEGWPAGLALVASGASPHLIPVDLVAEVLSTLRPDVRQALPEAAVVAVWREDTARDLGCHLPDDWLVVVRGSGLPLTPLGGGTYRPHSVLLEALELELCRTSPARHHALHGSAGLIAEQQGEVLQALSHYRRSKRHEDAMRVIELVAPRLAAARQQRVLRQVLESVPVSRLDTHLVSLLAFALIETGEAARGEALLENQATGDSTDVWILCALAFLAGRRGQYDRQLALTDQGLALALPCELQLSFLKARALALLNLGRPVEGLEAAREAVVSAESSGDRLRLGDALSILQFAHVTNGDWREREAVIHRALELHRALHQPLQALPHLTDLADQYRSQGRTAEATGVIEEAFATAIREPSGHLAYLLEARGDLHFWCARFGEALGDYRQALDRCTEFSVTPIIPRIWLKLSEAAFLAGQPDLSEAALQQGKALSRSGPRWLQPFLDLREGQDALRSGDLQLAARHFAAATEDSFERSHRPRALAYLAEIDRRTGRLSEAQLESLVGALDDLGTDDALRADTLVLQPLFAWCGQEARGPARRLGVLGQSRDAGSGSGSPGRTGLSLHTLGGLRLTYAGRPVRLGLAKSGEVLVWLALHGAAPRDQIVDALWDGSNDRRHLDYFRVAVRRLRVALQQVCGVAFNPVPFESGLYRLHAQLELTVDVHQLSAALDSRDVPTLRTALGNCQGEFVPEICSEWAAPVRLRVQEDAVAVALALGAALEQADPQAAKHAYRRATELDAFTEAGFSGLIRLNHTLGNATEAARVYESYSRFLAKECQSSPTFTLETTVASQSFTQD